MTGRRKFGDKYYTHLINKKTKAEAKKSAKNYKRRDYKYVRVVKETKGYGVYGRKTK